MYFSKDFKDSVESATIIDCSPKGFTDVFHTKIIIEFKQWWKFRKTIRFDWISQGDGNYLKPVEEIERTYQSLTSN